MSMIQSRLTLLPDETDSVCRYLYSEGLRHRLITMAHLGGLMYAPMNKIKFEWRVFLRLDTSSLNWTILADVLVEGYFFAGDFAVPIGFVDNAESATADLGLLRDLLVLDVELLKLGVLSEVFRVFGHGFVLVFGGVFRFGFGRVLRVV
ncbi:hypothetical protein BpHYR1_039136 [Brachionus plicatilis]|uniref:Uncharacterized protein n=1 Tax=Brachionus plicatilis TaxID=10195 RepID=A0A3M7QJY4_BRAPC|nr:hypothetical protein BpHYR1_039136 [Brachionus plicatilis]